MKHVSLKISEPTHRRAKVIASKHGMKLQEVVDRALACGLKEMAVAKAFGINMEPSK